MKTILLLLAVFCCPAAGITHTGHSNTCNTSTTFYSNSHYNINREQLTIRWLAKTLTQMGEAKTAKRLMDDYYISKRVRFGTVEDGNAETGPARNGVNEIIFSENMLIMVADMDRLLQQDPYGDNSSLISHALTVMHEYVHMDQVNPQNYPQWEDPAWHSSDKILNRWTQQTEAAYAAARKMPASKEKNAKLNELGRIIKKLQSELAATREAIGANVANGSVSPNQQWLLDDTEKRLQGMKDAMKKYDAVEQLGSGKLPQKKDPGYWEQVSVQAFDKLAPGDINYSVSAADGTLTARWALNNDVFKVTASYSSPPKQIRPADRIPVQITVDVSNQGDQYSGSGDFALFFDRPEIEPGSVIAPISLKTDNGVNGYIQFTHKPGVPPSPAASLTVYIDGKTLPPGSKGARIALLAAVYNGRSAGYRYIYEWKSNW